VSRCQDAIQAMATSINTVPPKPAGGGRASPVPQSPVGVLDAAGCVSYKTDDDAAVTVASHASASSSASSVTSSKRRKISRH
jgi:cyclin D1/2/4, plant